jgi:hypothetical protein
VRPLAEILRVCYNAAAAEEGIALAQPVAAGRKGRLLFILRLLATVVCVGIVLWIAPLRETGATLGSLALGAALLALAAELFQRILSILRWHLLLPPAGVRLPFLQTLRLGFIALFYNNFMPSSVGGDVAKSYLAIRGGQGSMEGVVASVLVDRFVVGWGSLVVFGLIISVFLDTPRYQAALVVLLGAGVIAAAVVLLLARRQLSAPDEQPRGALSRLLRKVADLLTRISAALLRYRHHRGALGASWLVSCAVIPVMGLGLQYWCAAVGHPVPFVRMMAVAVILKIVGIVPVSINNVGWSEGATLVLLEWAGLGRPEALAVAVLQRLAGIALSLIGAGAQFWQPKGKSPA